MVFFCSLYYIYKENNYIIKNTMSRKILISEEQYNMALKEGVVLQANPTTTNGNVGDAVKNTIDTAKKDGVNTDNATVSINAKDVKESIFLTKAQLRESRLKALKENSQVYTVKDFMKKLNIK